MKIAALLALLLAGCAVRVPLVSINDPPPPPDTYTRAEADAINATASCKLMARSLVQIARCETRRERP